MAIKVGTKAKFKSSGWKFELAEAMEVEVETIENLEGAEIIVMGEACDNYYDVCFPRHFDNDEKVVLIAYALSEVHINLD